MSRALRREETAEAGRAPEKAGGVWVTEWAGHGMCGCVCVCACVDVGQAGTRAGPPSEEPGMPFEDGGLYPGAIRNYQVFFF